MRLVVFHYHDRPGGVRQVIARGLPLLVARFEQVDEVVFLLGEQGDPAWLGELSQRLRGSPVRVVVHRNFGYSGGEKQVVGPDAMGLLQGVLTGRKTLVWAHNLSVGRNLALLRLLPEFCATAGARLWLHHHDWWWDGRWARWQDWLAAGVSGLEEALELSLPVGPPIRHWCVNQADLAWVRLRAGEAARWVGNPLPELTFPVKSEVGEAAAWLRQQSGGRRVWLAPVRALRRKNLAEAILLAQAQTEPTCIITTGGPSSPAEVPAWQVLCAAAARHHWPLVPAVLSGDESLGGHPTQRSGRPWHPTLPAFFAAADAIVMPSLQEGFGLPYLEAAALGKPLLARTLPEVSANLSALGCQLSGTYASLAVSTAAFDRKAEQGRIAIRWGHLQQALPAELAAAAEGPVCVEKAAVDFGCLTLEAQLEVLQSGMGPDFSSLHPEVPFWPENRRGEGWADRFDVAAAAAGGPDIPLPEGALLPEVLRRFRGWLEHPLLWL